MVAERCRNRNNNPTTFKSTGHHARRAHARKSCSEAPQGPAASRYIVLAIVDMIVGIVSRDLALRRDSHLLEVGHRIQPRSQGTTLCVVHGGPRWLQACARWNPGRLPLLRSACASRPCQAATARICQKRAVVIRSNCHGQ